jgi:hypothetical protein
MHGTLLHYSPVGHLPLVLRDGLKGGDVAAVHNKATELAVSLTTQADPLKLGCWGLQANPHFFKLAVRYVCRIDAGDPLLEPTRAAWKRLRYPPRACKILDPLGQSKWWYFYHGVIAPDRLTVELRHPGGYYRPTPEELADLAEFVAEERAKFAFEDDPNMPGVVYMKPIADDARPEVMMHPYPALPYMEAAALRN